MTRLSRRGMSLIEATISMLVVSVLLVAAFETVGMSRTGDRSMADRARAQQLALDLLSEILQQAYETPGETGMGAQPTKARSNRSQFTDVDDYEGWTESPPQDRSGNTLAGTTGWGRSVRVEWADPSTWAAAASAGPTGLKLITVNVTYKGTTLATIRAYRSVAWVDTLPSPTDSTENHPPTAAISASKLTDRNSLTTTLNASASADPDGDVLSYSWNFGDGTRGSGASVTRTYTGIGTYTATLIVYDGRGGVASATVTLSVTP